MGFIDLAIGGLLVLACTALVALSQPQDDDLR